MVMKKMTIKVSTKQWSIFLRLVTKWLAHNTWYSKSVCWGIHWKFPILQNRINQKILEQNGNKHNLTRIMECLNLEEFMTQIVIDRKVVLQYVKEYETSKKSFHAHIVIHECHRVGRYRKKNKEVALWIHIITKETIKC